MRAAPGRDKVTLFGISYGTKLALAYARAYPQHVERLLLDSVVDPDDATRSRATAYRRWRRRCGRCARAPAAASAPTRRPTWRARRAAAGRADARRRLRRCSAAARTGDADPLALLGPDVRRRLRPARCAPAMPAAVRRGARRRRRAAAAADRDRATPLRAPRPADVLRRPLRRGVRGDAAALGPAAAARRSARRRPGRGSPRWARARFFPFAFADVRADEIDLCLRWPGVRAAPRRRAGAYPAVPTLILQGGEDLRTPPAGSARVAARDPRRAARGRARASGTRCSAATRRAAACGAAGVLRGAAASRATCTRVPTLVPASPVPPRSLRRGGAGGRLPAAAGARSRARRHARRPDLRALAAALGSPLGGAGATRRELPAAARRDRPARDQVVPGVA